MKQLNERHTWFNLEKNEEYILRYTTKDGSMLDSEIIKKLENSNNKVIRHKYGVIVFKEPLTRIGNQAFYSCYSLTSVIIPNSVTSIGVHAFSSCIGLKSVDIPNSVKDIGIYAFYGCAILTSITIPSGVASIRHFAFYNCKQLKKITYIGTKEQFTNISHCAFEMSNITNIQYTDDAITI